MQTLSYGFKLPENGDKGTTLFDALAENIERLNAHSHDGTNSAPITSLSVQGVTITILAANWTQFGPVGHYRQLVSLPLGFDFDKVHLSVRTQAGEYCYPQIEKFDVTQFYIYTTDPTLTLTVCIGG